jgi:hypothetical protein
MRQFEDSSIELVMNPGVKWVIDWTLFMKRINRIRNLKEAVL